METIISRDTDIVREYLAALDARERGLSPFGRLAATVKLARLRSELDTAHLEASDEDIATLRREIDERISRTLIRRFEARRWGARLAIFFLLVAGQQVLLSLILLLAYLFSKTMPALKGWNPVLPYEQPGFLFAFAFAFFFATPMLALAALFGGRYFRAWRRTIPATLVILVLSAAGTYLVFRLHGREASNPVWHSTSLGQLASRPERHVNLLSYREWLDGNWLMKDPKFQRDYESYLRNGPGRWITSQFDAKDDAAWRNALPAISDYLDEGQDKDGFRDWLKYYLGRNRIYADDHVDQEVAALTNGDNLRFLGMWQVEPYLKERDQRLYRAYLGSVNRAMKGWGILNLALFAAVFLVIYLTGNALSWWERMAAGSARRGKRDSRTQLEPERGETTSRAPSLRERYYSFPEQREITIPPFFDTPFKVLSRVHRSFVRLAVFTGIVVFGFWAALYAFDLTSRPGNPTTQIDLMRSNIFFAGGASRDSGPSSGSQAPRVNADAAGPGSPLTMAGLEDADGGSSANREALLAARVFDVELQLDEADYQNNKKLKDEEKLILNQRTEINFLKSLSSQLQQTTTGALPEQIADATSRASAADARAGGALGDAAAAKQAAANLEKQVTDKLGEVEKRAARAADQAGKIEHDTSVLATRTEALSEELDRRARQVEARTEELGERTQGMKDREDRINRLQRVTFTAIVSSIKADVDDLDRRVGSAFYRLFSKGEAERDVSALRDRIAAISKEMRDAKADEVKELIGQLDELSNRVEQIAARVK